LGQIVRILLEVDSLTLRREIDIKMDYRPIKIHLYLAATRPITSRNSFSKWHLAWIANKVHKLREQHPELKEIIEEPEIIDDPVIIEDKEVKSEDGIKEDYFLKQIKKKKEWIKQTQDENFFFGITTLPTTPRPQKDKKGKLLAPENKFGIILSEEGFENFAILSTNFWESFSPPVVDIYILFFLVRNLLRSLTPKRFVHKPLPEEKHDYLCAMHRIQAHPIEIVDVINESMICDECNEWIDVEHQHEKERIERIKYFVQIVMKFINSKASEQMSNPFFYRTKKDLIKIVMESIKAKYKSNQILISTNNSILEKTPFDLIVKHVRKNIYSVANVCIDKEFISDEMINTIEEALLDYPVTKMIIYINDNEPPEFTENDRVILKNFEEISFDKGVAFSTSLQSINSQLDGMNKKRALKLLGIFREIVILNTELEGV